MAYEEALQGISIPAGADLSLVAANQYKAVKLTTPGVVLGSVAGEATIGILQNLPKLGDPAKVGFSGVSKVRATATITKGAALTVRADGGVGPAATGNFVIGTALEAAVANDVISALLSPASAAKF